MLRRPKSAANTGSAARPSTNGRRSTEVSDAKRLKALEDENTRLKKLLADAMLDGAVLKEPGLQ